MVTANPITETPAQKASATLAQILKNEFAGGRLRESEVVDAKLIRKTSREAFFDLDKFGTGIVYGSEL